MKHKIFLSIFLLFSLPLIFAHIFYHKKNWLPKHTLNHGHLIAPPLSLKDWKLDSQMTQHRWVLLFLQNGDCSISCQKSLYNMQQIQRALGKDMNRLQRVVITPPEAVLDHTLNQWLTSGNTSRWQLSTEDLTRLSAQPGYWFIVDPLGNIILDYPAKAEPEAILDDLKYLMGVSNIG